MFENADETKLGCSAPEAVERIEKTARHGETFEDLGVQKADGPRKAHLDHIMPLESLKADASLEQIRRMLHYSNIQILWADINLAKGSKIPTDWRWSEEEDRWIGNPRSWQEGPEESWRD